MRVDVGAARTRKGRERHPATFGRSHGERRGGRNGKEDLNAAHGGFLHHLIAGAAGNERGALLPNLTFTRTTTEQLIQRHVAAHVFMPTGNLSRRQYPRRRVRAAAELADRLYIVEVLKRRVEVRQIKGLSKRQWRNGLADIIELLNATHAAAGASGQRAAALVEDGDIIVLDTGTTTLHIARNIRDRQNVTVVTNDYQIARELEASPSIQTILLGGIVKKGYHCVVAINGRSILDTLNVDKAFMGTNSLSLKHGACVADIMLAETKRGMVEHASQVIIVCDYSKLNNTSLAQFTAADRIDTVVVDRLPDDVQAYRNAGIQVISLDEEEYL